MYSYMEYLMPTGRTIIKKKQPITATRFHISDISKYKHSW